MKHLNVLLATAGLIALTSACKHNKHHVIISEANDKTSLKIEYYGDVTFNDDSTAIARIAPKGNVKYQRDDQQLTAENGADGSIVYRFNNGDKKTDLTTGDKMFLKAAVKDMIKHGYYKAAKH